MGRDLRMAHPKVPIEDVSTWRPALCFWASYGSDASWWTLISCTWSEVNSQTDRQTDRQTDNQILHPREIISKVKRLLMCSYDLSSKPTWKSCFVCRWDPSPRSVFDHSNLTRSKPLMSSSERVLQKERKTEVAFGGMKVCGSHNCILSCSGAGGPPLLPLLS